MAHKVEVSEEIDEIVYKITLNNLNSFEMYRSKTFYVCGNPWTIGLRKKEIGEGAGKEDCLGVYLYIEEENRPANWAIVANFTLKIISAKCNGAPHEFKSGTFVFDSKAISWGNANVISWQKIIDPNQGYVHNDTCKIVVNVNSSPLQHAENAEFIELIPIEKWCDASINGKFYLKVNQAQNFVNVCSPEITLGNSRWRFVLCRTQVDNGPVAAQNEYILQLKLYNSSMGRKTTAKLIMASLTCKIVSAEPSVNWTIHKMENKEFRFRITEQALNIISWNELFDPKEKIIENDSFTLELCLQVSGTASQPAERPMASYNNNNNCNSTADRSICPICLDYLSDKLALVPICGHVMCMDCSIGVLEQKPICPTCNIKIDRLQRVYLSTE